MKPENQNWVGRLQLNEKLKTLYFSRNTQFFILNRNVCSRAYLDGDSQPSVTGGPIKSKSNVKADVGVPKELKVLVINKEVTLLWTPQ